MSDFKGFRSLKANFTATPNQFFDKVLGHYHSCVVTVVGILIRSTLGWEDPDTGDRRQEAELSLSDFVRPELSRGSARKGIAGAIEAGLIAETLPATNHRPARYALKWDDAEQQERALEKERRAHVARPRKGSQVQDPKWKKTISRGTTNAPQARGATVRPPTVRRLDSAPPLYKVDSERNSDSEKKEKEESSLSSTSLEKEKPVETARRALAEADTPFARDYRKRKGGGK